MKRCFQQALLMLLAVGLFYFASGCGTTAERSLNQGERWKLVPAENAEEESPDS